MNRGHARLSGAAVAALALVTAGCLGEPELEDRWTRVDTENESVQVIAAGSGGVACSVSVRTIVTYRRILTGFAVSELRATTAVPVTAFANDDDRLAMAQSIDLLLQNSVGLGRATRAVTGWDHLIQTIPMQFVGGVPTVFDTTTFAPGVPVNLFLVSYLADGEEIELPDGSDSLVITPMISTDREVLPIARAIDPATLGMP